VYVASQFTFFSISRSASISLDSSEGARVEENPLLVVSVAAMPERRVRNPPPPPPLRFAIAELNRLAYIIVNRCMYIRVCVCVYVNTVEERTSEDYRLQVVRSTDRLRVDFLTHKYLRDSNSSAFQQQSVWFSRVLRPS